MAKFERVNDKWAELRRGLNLFGAIEPEVRLDAITTPIASEASSRHAREMLPALAASVSYGSTGAIQTNPDRALALNAKLIKMGHHTPLEAIQFNFFVTGISKSCGAQISRHRIGQGHVSSSRRFQSGEVGFVYPLLDYIDDEKAVRTLLLEYSRLNKVMAQEYKAIFGLAVKKEDARLILPVSRATQRYWFINARALRDFLKLRLAADSEWEIRRLAWMLFDVVRPMLPSLFSDLGDA
jgi:thymidylate synthase (FAD)